MRVALILALVTGGLIQAAHAEPVAAPRPDDVALRYYAAQKRTDRVEAEIERLRRRHPGWQPPADLWTAEPGGEDEGPFWDLLGSGRLAELRAGLAERARTEPGWKPSAALARALVRRELRLDALSLAKAGRWSDLTRLADTRTADIDPSEAELGWVVAEAFGRTERGPDALTLLKRMMAAPDLRPDQRRVTLLRAMAFLSMGDIDRLVSLARPGDVEPIRIDLIRARLSAVLHDEAGQAVSADDLSAFETYAEAAADANQPALVAWYAFKRRDFPIALAWFKRAIARGGDAMIAHGLAHTLRELGLRREAEDVAYAWREPLVNNTLLFIDLLETDLTRAIPPVIEPERLRRYAQVTAATASGEGAQALAWYAYNNCQFDTALGWFKRAVAWFPKEATVYGYALTQRRLHQQRAFIETVNRYDGLFPKVVDLLFQPANDHPMPCEPGPPKPNAQPAASPQASRYLDLSARTEPAGTGRRARVPGPDDLGASVAAAPQIRRSDFPVAVQMENDLRIAPTGTPDGAPDLRWPGHAIGRPSTIARRVPGVGPMPYERFGFSLKGGWNGEAAPSSPTAAEKPAPVGSLWSDQAGASAGARADVDSTGSLQPLSSRPRKPVP
jgi:cellulose synthase operon protein C